MTFAPKKALVAAAVSIATLAGATATTTTTAQANEYVAGGIGFVAGTILGSALTQAHQPQTVVVHQQPVVVHGRPAAWTPAWYASCSNRYRSFNPNTGYWLHVSGQYRFCQ
ncbi:MAG: BA14K family protein [Hyphomicrobiales bacterium]